ncbi:MAG: hypothetical protein MUE51_16010 [Thermoleophilia bacterium]|nr:hypothetical protein [Thermoleophilia bacterium]
MSARPAIVVRPRRVRAPGRRVALALAVPLLAGALAGPAMAAPGDGRASAKGFGALIGGTSTASAIASSQGRPLREAAANGVGGPGVVAGRVSVRVGAGADGAAARAEGQASARDVILLDGRVVVSGLRMSVRATAAPGGGEAGLADFGADGLMVDGQPVSASPGQQIEVGGVGTLVLFERVVEGGTAVRANALRLEVTDPASGLVDGRGRRPGRHRPGRRARAGPGARPGPRRAPAARPRPPAGRAPGPLLARPHAPRPAGHRAAHHAGPGDPGAGRPGLHPGPAAPARAGHRARHHRHAAHRPAAPPGAGRPPGPPERPLRVPGPR